MNNPTMIYAAVVQFYMQCDAEVRKIKTSCQKGCSYCCRYPVMSTEPEAIVIEQHLRFVPQTMLSRIKQKWTDWQQRIQKEGLGKVDMLDYEAYSNEYFIRGIECPFLLDDECSIYQVRPLICRSYFTTESPETCKTSKTDEQFKAFWIRKRQELDGLYARIFPKEKIPPVPLVARMGHVIQGRK